MMAKKIFKKSILKLKENAANMPNAEFKKEGNAILSSIVKIVDESITQGKEASKSFYNGVNKELDILSKMINSSEYTIEQKIDFANRISVLVKKLEKNKLIKEGIIAGLLLILGGDCTKLF